MAASTGLVARVAMVAPTARWRIADTSAATNLVTSPATGATRDSVGLVGSGEHPQWLFFEHVPNAELGASVAGQHVRRMPPMSFRGYQNDPREAQTHNTLGGPWPSTAATIPRQKTRERHLPFCATPPFGLPPFGPLLFFLILRPAKRQTCLGVGRRLPAPSPKPQSSLGFGEEEVTTSPNPKLV